MPATGTMQDIRDNLAGTREVFAIFSPWVRSKHAAPKDTRDGPTLDDRIWRLTEPNTPPPRQRLRALARLRDAGIEAGVGMAPILPGLSDRSELMADVVKAAREAGATVLAEPVDRDWGGCSAYFADPEGNTWEIAWLPGATFDERGALIWPY